MSYETESKKNPYLGWMYDHFGPTFIVIGSVLGVVVLLSLLMLGWAL